MFGFWPYTNFHQLNLDWIIKEVKENNRKVEEFGEQLEEMGVTVQQLQEYIDNIDAEIQEKVDTEVPAAIQEAIATGGFNQLLTESHRRRVVMIGDSYAQGWTPDGVFDGWPGLVKQQLNIADADYTLEAQGGAGFGKTSAQGRMYVPALVQAAASSISTPETVTDIIIALGYNDYAFTNNLAQVSTGLQNTIAACHTLFPVARIHLFAIGFTTNIANQYNLNVVYNSVYAKEYLEYGFYNITESLNHVSFFASDGIHPVQAGQNRIARNIVRCLSGSEPDYYFTLLAASSVTFELLMGNPGQVTDVGIAISPQENELFATTMGQFKQVTVGNSGTITLPGNTVHKLAKLAGMGDYTGYFNPNQYIACPAKMSVIKQGESTFTDFDVMLSIGTDSSHTDIFLYVTVMGTNGASFQTTGAFTKFLFQGVNHKIPFITNSNVT